MQFSIIKIQHLLQGRYAPSSKIHHYPLNRTMVDFSRSNAVFSASGDDF